MKIHAIIQSSDYADMLAITLPLNLPNFDSVVVYTKRGDEATKLVCKNNGVQCIETDGFFHGGSKFNRGKVYNEEFVRFIQNFGNGIDFPWFCIIDADIVLPSDAKKQFEGLPPEAGCFYGARRYNVETQEQWEEVKKNEERLKDLTLFRGYGFGYLQIFHAMTHTFVTLFNQTGGHPYLEWKDGGTADYVFRNNWGDCPWNPPTQPPLNILNHSLSEPVDPPTGLLRKLPFSVIHLGVTGIGGQGRGSPIWETK